MCDMVEGDEYDIAVERAGVLWGCDRYMERGVWFMAPIDEWWWCGVEWSGGGGWCMWLPRGAVRDWVGVGMGWWYVLAARGAGGGASMSPLGRGSSRASGSTLVAIPRTGVESAGG
jgi:hypothetical protein